MPPTPVGVLAFFRNLPFVTRCHLTVLLATTALVHLHVVRERNIHFDAALVSRGQIWRLLTSFGFFGRAGLSLMFYIQTHLFMGLAMENSLEASVRHVFLHMLAMPLIAAAALLLDAPIPFLSQALFTAIMFFYSYTFPTHPVSLMGIWTIDAGKLIWWSLAFQMITGQPLAGVLLGTTVGAALWKGGFVARVPEVVSAPLTDFVRQWRRV